MHDDDSIQVISFNKSFQKRQVKLGWVISFYWNNFTGKGVRVRHPFFQTGFFNKQYRAESIFGVKM